jgi:hypothetical protein
MEKLLVPELKTRHKSIPFLKPWLWTKQTVFVMLKEKARPNHDVEFTVSCGLNDSRVIHYTVWN